MEAARKSSNACFDAQSVVVEWQPLLLPAAAAAAAFLPHLKERRKLRGYAWIAH